MSSRRVVRLLVAVWVLLAAGCAQRACAEGGAPDAAQQHRLQHGAVGGSVQAPTLPLQAPGHDTAPRLPPSSLHDAAQQAQQAAQQQQASSSHSQQRFAAQGSQHRAQRPHEVHQPGSFPRPRVPVAVVSLMSGCMALMSCLGVLPYFFCRKLSKPWGGAANAVASGVMLAASFGLLAEGAAYGGTYLILGMLLGVVFVKFSQEHLEQFEVEGFEQLAGADARKVILFLGVMAVHAVGEGGGVGVSFAGDRGWAQGTLVTLAIGLHNVPEGLAVATVMAAKGTPPHRALLWTALTAAPQALVAPPAYVFVDACRALLPLAMGFAAGCMVWVVLAELLPDALEALEPGRVATCATASAAWLQGLSIWIAHLETPAGTLASPFGDYQAVLPRGLAPLLPQLAPALLLPPLLAAGAARLAAGLPRQLVTGAAAGAVAAYAGASWLQLLLGGRHALLNTLLTPAVGAAAALALSRQLRAWQQGRSHRWQGGGSGADTPLLVHAFDAGAAAVAAGVAGDAAKHAAQVAWQQQQQQQQGRGGGSPASDHNTAAGANAAGAAVAHTVHNGSHHHHHPLYHHHQHQQQHDSHVAQQQQQQQQQQQHTHSAAAAAEHVPRSDSTHVIVSSAVQQHGGGHAHARHAHGSEPFGAAAVDGASLSAAAATAAAGGGGVWHQQQQQQQQQQHSGDGSSCSSGDCVLPVAGAADPRQHHSSHSKGLGHLARQHAWGFLSGGAALHACGFGSSKGAGGKGSGLGSHQAVAAASLLALTGAAAGGVPLGLQLAAALVGDPSGSGHVVVPLLLIGALTCVSCLGFLLPLLGAHRLRLGLSAGAINAVPAAVAIAALLSQPTWVAQGSARAVADSLQGLAAGFNGCVVLLLLPLLRRCGAPAGAEPAVVGGAAGGLVVCAGLCGLCLATPYCLRVHGMG